jgi:hypothetical protein
MLPDEPDRQALSLVNKLPEGARITSTDPLTGSARVTMPDGTRIRLERPLSVEEEAQRFITARLGDFAGKLNMSHMPNIDVMADPDGVKASLLQVADDNKGLIEAARRGVITRENLIGIAQGMAVNGNVVQQVLSRDFGKNAPSPELMLAARMMQEHMLGMLHILGDKIGNRAASADEIIQWQKLKQIFTQFRVQLSGATAEWGRTGIALSTPVGMPDVMANHVAGLLKQGNPDMEAEARAVAAAMSPSGVSLVLNGYALMPVWRRWLQVVPQEIGIKLFINGLLSSPGTFFKIAGGNLTNLIAHQVDLTAAGFARQGAALAAYNGRWISDEEGVRLFDAYAHLHGIVNGFADAARVGGLVMRTGKGLDQLAGGRALETGPRKSFQTIFPETQDNPNSYFAQLVRGVDLLIELPGRGIGGNDAFYQTLGARGYAVMMALKEARMRALAGTLDIGDITAFVQDKLLNQTPEFRQAYEDYAHRITFQRPWPQADFGKPPFAGEAFQKFLNAAPILRIVFPFMRTATDIFKQAIGERTGAGLLFSNLRNQIAGGGMQRDLALTRIALGWGAVMTAAWLAAHDRISGSYPASRSERAVWDAEGRTPGSWRWTNPFTGKEHWTSFMAMEPFATLLVLGADLVDLNKRIATLHDTDKVADLMSKSEKVAGQLLAATVENFSNKSTMQGAANLAELWHDPAGAGLKYLKKTGASMQPFSGFTHFMRNIQDPYLRQAQTMMEEIRNHLPTIPGVDGSKTLAPALDIFGEPRERAGGDGFDALSPLPSSLSKKDEVTDEIDHVMTQTGTVPIGMPSDRITATSDGKGTLDGSGLKLSPREYNEYVSYARNGPLYNGGMSNLREKLAGEFKTEAYKRMTPAERSAHISVLVNAGDAAGRAMLIARNQEFAARLKEYSMSVERIKHTLPGSAQ